MFKSEQRLLELNSRLSKIIESTGRPVDPTDTTTALINKTSESLNELKTSNDELTMRKLDLTDTLCRLINEGESEERKDIVIPMGVKKIRPSAFYNVKGINAIIIPDGVTAIGSEAFYNCDLKNVTTPSNTTKIGDYAFYGCDGLTTVTIGGGEIGKYAFNQCNSLTTVTMENGVTGIGEKAFYDCSELMTLMIPNSIRYIYYNSFYTCHKLQYVTLEAGYDYSGLDLSVSTKYSRETIVSWFNALKDRTGGSSSRLTIGNTNLKKLTAEDKAIATNKNWTIV